MLTIILPGAVAVTQESIKLIVLVRAIILKDVRRKIKWTVTREDMARIAVIASVVFENAGYIRMARIYPAFFSR
jgi:hypothetical protein